MQPLTRFCHSVCPSRHPRPLLKVGAHLRFQQISDEIAISTCSGTSNPSSTAVRGSIWAAASVLGAAPHLVFQLHLPITPPQTLSTKVGSHLRFQKISDEITISTCSGTLNPSFTVVRGSIWPHRARCSPLHAFAAPFVHHTTPALKVPKLVHLRFQQISDQITIAGGCNSERRSGTTAAWVNPSPNRRG